jgi:2-C-methyl-D-erythritol 4-phosphate cytidylyltransferase
LKRTTEIKEFYMSDKDKKETAGKIADVIRAISGKTGKRAFTSAIILAAGSSRRMGNGGSKQMLMIDGLSVVARTVIEFERSASINEIIIVAKKDEIPLYDGFAEQHGIKKPLKVIEGGQTRQESARLGSDVVDERAKFIAIHDAARCLITDELIDKVCHGAYTNDAAILAIKATDTVKIADRKAFIESTPDREYAWQAQTPQVFKTKLYRAAAYTALKKGFEATDDNSLVENVGHPIRLVECGAQNIKITTRDDLAIADGVLAERERVEKYFNYEAD